VIDPAIKKIRDAFVRNQAAEMRAQGFDEKRIAWLLGPEAVANENEKRRGRVYIDLAVAMRSEGASWNVLGQTFGVRAEVARRAVLMVTNESYRERAREQNARYSAKYRSKQKDKK